MNTSHRHRFCTYIDYSGKPVVCVCERERERERESVCEFGLKCVSTSR